LPLFVLNGVLLFLLDAAEFIPRPPELLGLVPPVMIDIP